MLRFDALSESVAHVLPAKTPIGEYEVVAVLGAGGMGTVYAGVHPVIGKRVAIKVLAPHLSHNPRMIERFVQEARAVVKIQHHHIIDVFAFGHAPDVGHYFVMPLLDGESLGDRIKRGGPLSLDEALPILEQISDALDTAHEMGIFHRDLKPDNVYLAAERNGSASVRILDFGIAKLLESDVSATQTGVQMGTPLFMSPEQWEGDGVDHRTDIYALGVLVHHLLTGRYPFESQSPIGLMNMHANQEPTPASTYGADPAVDPVIAQALAKDKTHRFDSAGAVCLALRTATTRSDLAAVVPRSEPSEAIGNAATELSMSPAPSSTRRNVAMGLGLVVAAAAGLSLLLLGGDAPPTPPRPASHIDGDASAAAGALQTASAAPDAAGAPALASEDAGAVVEKTGAVVEKTGAVVEKTGAGHRQPKRVGSTEPTRKPPEAKTDPLPTPTQKKPKEETKTQWGQTTDPF